MKGLKKWHLLILLLLITSFAGIIFIFQLNNSSNSEFSGIFRDLVGYVFFGIPLFSLLISLFRLSISGKHLIFYLTSILASLLITIFLWLLNLINIYVITSLNDFFWFSLMIFIMLVIPVQLVRAVVILSEKNRRS